MAVPAYIDPTSDPAAWAQLTGSKPASWDRRGNVDNGPGRSPCRRVHRHPPVARSGSTSSVTSTRATSVARTGHGPKAWRPDPARPLGGVAEADRRGHRGLVQYYGSTSVDLHGRESQRVRTTAYSTLYADEYRVLSEFVRRQQPGGDRTQSGTAVGQCFQTLRTAGDVRRLYQAYTGGGGSPTEAYRPLGGRRRPRQDLDIIYGRAPRQRAPCTEPEPERRLRLRDRRRPAGPLRPTAVRFLLVVEQAAARVRVAPVDGLRAPPDPIRINRSVRPAALRPARSGCSDPRSDRRLRSPTEANRLKSPLRPAGSDHDASSRSRRPGRRRPEPGRGCGVSRRRACVGLGQVPSTVFTVT